MFDIFLINSLISFTLPASGRENKTFLCVCFFPGGGLLTANRLTTKHKQAGHACAGARARALRLKSVNAASGLQFPKIDSVFIVLEHSPD